MVTCYYTFGSDHAFPEGYIKINGPTSEDCREEMVKRFGSKWAFEYFNTKVILEYGLKLIKEYNTYEH